MIKVIKSITGVLKYKIKFDWTNLDVWVIWPITKYSLKTLARHAIIIASFSDINSTNCKVFKSLSTNMNNLLI